MTHLLSIADLQREQITDLLDCADELRGVHNDSMAGKTLAMLFEKPSLRTRVSFEVAMQQLGGHAINLRPDEVGLGKREAVQDVARVLGSMCDVIMARVFSQKTVEMLVKWAGVPVINGLSDTDHPCQALADALTIRRHFGQLEGVKMVFIGDGNNVARSLAEVCGRMGMSFTLASPRDYAFVEDVEAALRDRVAGIELYQAHDVSKAVADADVLYTDTWTSMGQESESAKRRKDFTGYCVDEKLLAAAPDHAVIMHCLPAHRGEEISDGAMEHERSLIFDQAENRLHAQKAVLATVMKPAEE